MDSDFQGTRVDALASASTWGEALRLASAQLQISEDIATPTLDAQVLLAYVVAVPRATLLAYPERALSAEHAAQYAALVARRSAHEPVAYLTGEREFMGLSFHTDARALIPRPETELLVEAALTELRARLDRRDGADTAPRVADIGTGSGAIALAVAALEPRLPRIYATDISAAALALAAENAERLGVMQRVSFLQGDLLEPLPEPMDLLLANLPYVAPDVAPQLPADVRDYEPSAALYGAGDGLGHLRRFFAQAPTRVCPGAALFLEFGYDQAAATRALAEAAFPGCAFEIGKDYAGWDRYAIVRVNNRIS